MASQVIKNNCLVLSGHLCVASSRALQIRFPILLIMSLCPVRLTLFAMTLQGSCNAILPIKLGFIFLGIASAAVFHGKLPRDSSARILARPFNSRKSNSHILLSQRNNHQNDRRLRQPRQKTKCKMHRNPTEMMTSCEQGSEGKKKCDRQKINPH